jgi:hypothetical protein
MPLTLLGFSKDLRTKTTIVYGQADIQTYLDMIGSNFDDFTIQRKRENHRAYSRLKADITKGAQLPAITLALKPDTVGDYVKAIKAKDLKSIQSQLIKKPQLHILDGLQRSYILKDIEAENFKFNPEQKLLLEFWFESNIKVLIYRIIVLNAGQKPMSMRHQVELLFETIVHKLKKDIPHLSILKEKEEDRRFKPREYQLARLVSAYHCYLLKTPEVTKESIVTQQLLEEDLFSITEDQAEETFVQFEELLRQYCKIDDSICRVYQSTPENREKGIPVGLGWWGGENVMNSFFAAVADFSSDKERSARAKKALIKLEQLLSKSEEGADPLGLASLDRVLKAINPRKTNVGFATRKLLTGVFKEFLRDEGQSSMASLWAKEAS